ncbi:hypothetical protein ACSBR2_035289 [Camellia fascicularis]
MGEIKVWRPRVSGAQLPCLVHIAGRMWERFLGVHKPAVYRFANVENFIFGVHKPAISRVGESGEGKIYSWRTWENQAKSIAAQELQVRSVATLAEAVARFDKMVSGDPMKALLIGRGGSHPTIVVFIDPTHSLSDSFYQVFKCASTYIFGLKSENCCTCFHLSHHKLLVLLEKCVYDLLQFAFTHCIKDLAGGMLVPVQGLDSPLYALEINPDKVREEFRTASQKYSDSGVRDLMDSMGLGMLAE